MVAIRRTPKVSVTVVTYNHGTWLGQCLESIVTQETDFTFEVIVGDDASTDGVTRHVLVDYVQRYPDLITAILRDKNVGANRNYEDVLSKTSGEFIAHIDGDDLMLPGKLQRQVQFFESHPECHIVAHDVRVIDESGCVISNSLLNRRVPSITDINYLVLHGCFFTNSSKMCRREAIRSWHMAKPTVDFFRHVEQAASGHIGYIDEVLGAYRKNSGSMSDALNPASEVLRQAYEDAFDLALELGVNEMVCRKGRLRHRYGTALNLLRYGCREKFCEEARLSPQEWPYASWKQRVVHILRNYPAVVHWLMKVKGAA